MAAYTVVLVHDVRDPEKLGRYAAEVAPLVARHGGTYRAVDFAPAAAEGDRPAGVVLIEFPDDEAQRGFYASDEYAPLKAERQAAAACTFLQITGL
jgi:uncharacterized protein (DUF1330 family)